MEYSDLQPLADFSELHNPANYVNVPDGWWVIITDVVDSTGAIAAGLYREVNTVGIASIVCVRRVFGEEAFPFTFGGDGATLCVPGPARDSALATLGALQRLARERFGLTLRVGAESVTALRRDGYSLRMARYEIVPGQSIAMFWGTGFDAADARIRANGGVTPASVHGDSGAVDLSGMSCRWQPVPSQRGVVLSLIARAQEGQDEQTFYRTFLSRLDGTLAGGLEAANPVRTQRLKYRGFVECIRDEIRYHHGFSWSLVKRMGEIVLAVAIFRYRLPGIGFNARHYANSLRTHCDFRKFDNALRMTLDCTPSEAEAIRRICDEEYRSGCAYYGLFETDSALMTCFLDGLGDGEHLHFVDAVNGGYAEAARYLKAQMRLAQRGGDKANPDSAGASA